MYTEKHALTQIHVHGTSRSVGRTKQIGEQVRVTLVEGSIALIDSALYEGEERLKMIRDAINAELQRRGHDHLPLPPEPKGKRRPKKPD